MSDRVSTPEGTAVPKVEVVSGDLSLQIKVTDLKENVLARLFKVSFKIIHIVILTPASLLACTCCSCLQLKADTVFLENDFTHEVELAVGEAREFQVAELMESGYIPRYKIHRDAILTNNRDSGGLGESASSRNLMEHQYEGSSVGRMTMHRTAGPLVPQESDNREVPAWKETVSSSRPWTQDFEPAAGPRRGRFSLSLKRPRFSLGAPASHSLSQQREAYYKRTIPYVTLTIDDVPGNSYGKGPRSGASLCVDTVKSNL